VHQAVRAVAVLHEHGLVHRDVSPINMFLFDERHHLKLGDFGIARSVRQDGTRLTTIGVALGNPRFGAPEQFYAPASVDQRADIYGLGISLYFMLLAELDERDPTAYGKSWLKSTGDEALDAIIARATHLEPRRRYRDLAAFDRALQRWGEEHGP
jgi:serine/threonine-protein kinase